MSDSRVTWPAVFAAVWIPIAMILLRQRHQLMMHMDIGWHLMAGRLYRELGEVTTTDSFSWTIDDTPWFNLSWGFDVLASLLEETAGYSVLLVLAIGVGATVCGLVAVHALVRGAGPLAAWSVAFIAGLVVPFYALPDVPVSISPQTVTLLLGVVFHLFAATTILREAPARKHLVLYAVVVPPFLWAWCNTHGGWVVGYSLAGIVVADGVLRRRWGSALVAGAALSIALCLLPLNPLGVGIIEAIIRTLGGGAKDYVSEWQPLYSNGGAVALLYLITAGIALTLLRPRHLIPTDLMIALLWGVAGVRELRHFALFVVFTSPIVAVGLHEFLMRFEGLETLNGRLVTRWSTARARWISGLGIGGTALAIPAILGWVSPEEGPRPPESMVPYEEVELLTTRWPDARLLNDWNYGGYITWASGGGTRVFIDGRAGSAYPAELMDGYYQHFILANGLTDYLEKYDIEVILVGNFRPQITSRLDELDDWVLVQSGEAASLYVRDDVVSR